MKTINTKNLAEIAWRCGYRGVADLARKIGKAPPTVWNAVRWQHHYKPTIRLLNEALNLDNPAAKQ